MSKQKWINLVSVYSIIYTVITLLNSVGTPVRVETIINVDFNSNR